MAWIFALALIVAFWAGTALVWYHLERPYLSLGYRLRRAFDWLPAFLGLPGMTTAQTERELSCIRRDILWIHGSTGHDEKADAVVADLLRAYRESGQPEPNIVRLPGHLNITRSPAL